MTRSRPIGHPPGAFQGHVGTSVDVTERRAEERQRELLTRELAHRVRNTLSIVSALARTTFADVEGSGQAIKDFQGRLGALAASNEIVLQRQWKDIDLREIIEPSVAFAGQERFFLSGPEVRLPPSPALYFMLTLHELCTNAMKYGALACEGGSVRVTWTASAEDEITLVWREINGPPVRDSTTMGSGMRMIKSALEQEL